jgi:hypothetical protein
MCIKTFIYLIMFFLHTVTGMLIIYALTTGLCVIMTSILISEDYQEDIGFQSVTIAVSTLVAFLVTTRISLASDQANKICNETQATITTYIRLSKNIQPIKKGCTTIVRGIEQDSSVLHDYIHEQVYNGRITDDRSHDDAIALQVSYDAARTAYHRGSQIVFDQMLYSLIVFYYGLLAPLAAFNDFGDSARWVIPIVAGVNFYVLYFAIRMEKPNLQFIIPV